MRTTNYTSKPFVLAAHSCGGVIASSYALTYNMHPITKLVLLSANGIEDKEMNLMTIRDKLWFFVYRPNFVKYVLKLFRGLGWRVINFLVSLNGNRFFCEHAEEKVEGPELDLLIQTFLQFLLKDQGSESFIAMILRSDNHGQ